MLANIASYPGIRGVESATYTCSVGITPSQVVIAAAPPFDQLAPVGDCELSDGQTTIVIPDCCFLTMAGQQSGTPNAVTIVLLDHRWRWKYGWISGRYNIQEFQPNSIPLASDLRPPTPVRDKPGSEPIHKRTQKSARKLAELCLKAMGERNYRIDVVPDDVYPSVDWDGVNPALALQALVEQFGCIVVWRNRERAVWVCRKGDGAPLPQGALLAQSQTVEIQTLPTSIMVLTSRIRYQQRFALEYCGRDFDGSLRPLDQLSYRPADGDWTKTGADGWFNLSDSRLPPRRSIADARQLARSCIRKYFRIKDGVAASLWVPPDATDDYRNRKLRYQIRLLPILNQTFKDEFGRTVQGAARVLGIHTRAYRMPQQPGAWLGGAGLKWEDTRADTPVEVSFTINPDEQLVVFSAPVYKLVNGTYHEPELVLECCAEVMDNVTHHYIRDYVERQLPSGQSTEPLTIIRDDIISQVTAQYVSGSNTLDQVTDNFDEVDRQCQLVIDGELRKLEATASGDITLPGLHAIEPDGALLQITWSIGGGSATNPSTRVSRNSEHNWNLPTFPMRRRLEETSPEQWQVNRAIVSGVKALANAMTWWRKTEDA